MHQDLASAVNCTLFSGEYFRDSWPIQRADTMGERPWSPAECSYLHMRSIVTRTRMTGATPPLPEPRPEEAIQRGSYPPIIFNYRDLQAHFLGQCAVNCTECSYSISCCDPRRSSEVQLIALDVRDIPVISAVHQNRPHLFRRLDETPHHNP